MNTKPNLRIGRWIRTAQPRAARTAVLLLLLLLPAATWAGGVVTNCTEADLRAAMAGGGVVTFACDGTITLASTITIAADTSLDGSGRQVTISGNRAVRVFYGAVRVFYVTTGASLTLIHLTISNGRTSDGANGMWISEGHASDGGPGEPGGGIYNDGTLILLDCVVTANRTGNGGLGYSGPSGSGLGSAGGPGGSGGGIYNAGTLTLSNCIVSGNSAGDGGTSGFSSPVNYSPAGGNGGFGAGIYNAGTLRLDNSTVTNNSAGKGADNPMKGPGANGGAGGGIWSGGSLTANGCTFSGNSSGAGGTGGHSAVQGGDGGAGGPGGAICGTGYFALANCTLPGNSAGRGGTGGYAVNGSGGRGGQGGSGAAIYSQTSLDVVSCTIAANDAGSGGAGGTGGSPGAPGVGGGVRDASGTAQLLNTIVALNTGNEQDLSGAFLSLGYNLIGATNGSSGFPGAGDQVGSSAAPLDPRLGPLADNGGPTMTMALLAGSPAIDAGNSSLAPATDQRGFPRPAGLAADIGAFEYGSVMPTIAISLSGATGLNILASGNAGGSCRLLSSPDLSSWAPLATSQFGSDGTVLFYDDCATNGACRFYRLVMP